MDYGLDSVLRQIFLQFIAMPAADGEDMKHMRVPVFHLGEDDFRILDVLDIISGHLPALEIVLVEMLQLHVQNCCLNLVKPAVAAFIFEHVFAGGAIVRKGAHRFRKFGVVGSHRAGIAERSEILAGVEAVAGGVAERTGMAAFELASVCLSIVLHEFEIIFLAKFSDLVGICALAVEMDYKDGPRPVGYGRLYLAVVYLVCVDVRLHEDRSQSVLRNRQNRSDVGVGGDDDLISGLHHSQFDISAEDPYQRVQTVSAAHGIFRADICGIVGLELPVLFALKIPAAVDDSRNSGIDFIAVKGGNLL